MPENDFLTMFWFQHDNINTVQYNYMYLKEPVSWKLGNIIQIRHMPQRNVLYKGNLG